MNNGEVKKLGVSVIIPALNEEKQLPILLRSLSLCNSLDIEVIVVDGKSEDKTLEIVSQFSKQAEGSIKFRGITSDKRNVSYQRNLGAENASNEILVFMDADTAIM